MSLKAHLTEDMKTAMRAKDTLTLSTIRLANAEIKLFQFDGFNGIVAAPA